MKFEQYNHLCVMKPEGELAGPEADALRRAAEGQAAANIVVDCEAVPFISGVGLEALLAAGRRCESRAGRLRLARLNDECRKILEITRLQDRFDCHRSVAGRDEITHESPPRLKPLGQRLVGRGLLQPQQLEAALARAEARTDHERLLGEILVELQVCSDEQVAEALAESCGVPFARVSPRLADPLAVGLLPKEFLERNGVLPLFLVEGMLTVAVDGAGEYLPG